MDKLTREQERKFYEWLEQFIFNKGYESFNPTDGGEYRIVTTDGDIFYRSTYEYNDWIKNKKIEYQQI